MALTANTGMIINGVGSGMLIGNTGEITTITRGQNLSLQITSSEEKVYGGDSLFPFFTYIKEKGGKLSIDDAVFNLNHLKLTQNASVNTTTAKKYISEEITVATGTTAQVTATTGVDYATCVCYKKDTSTILTNVGTGTPATATEYKISALGVVTFGASTSGVYIFSYYVTDSTATISATVMSDLFPGTCELRWKLRTSDEDGNAYDINLRAKKVKNSGSVNLDFKRGKLACHLIQ